MVVEEKERGVGSTVEDDCSLRTRGSTAVTHFKGSLYPGPQLQHPHIFSFRASRHGCYPLCSASFLLFPQFRELDTGSFKLSWKSFNLQPYISVRKAVSSWSTFGVRVAMSYMTCTKFKAEKSQLRRQIMIEMGGKMPNR